MKHYIKFYNRNYKKFKLHHMQFKLKKHKIRKTKLHVCYFDAISSEHIRNIYLIIFEFYIFLQDSEVFLFRWM